MKKAFSLMELMIVIIILGLLATLIMPNLIGKGEQAKRKIVCVQMKNIVESAKMFKIDLGHYPSTEEGISALIKNPDAERYPDYPKGGYIESKSAPRDPWNSPYIYIYEDGEVELISLGADQKEGGVDQDRDILFSKCQK